MRAYRANEELFGDDRYPEGSLSAESTLEEKDVRERRLEEIQSKDRPPTLTKHEGVEQGPMGRHSGRKQVLHVDQREPYEQEGEQRKIEA